MGYFSSPRSNFHIWEKNKYSWASTFFSLFLSSWPICFSHVAGQCQSEKKGQEEEEEEEGTAEKCGPGCFPCEEQFIKDTQFHEN